MGNLFSCVFICGATEKVKIVNSTHTFEEADFRLPNVVVETQHAEESSEEAVVKVESTKLDALPTTRLTREQEGHEIYFLIPVDISSKSREKPGRMVSLQLRYCSINLDRTKTKKPGEMENSHVLPEKPPVMIEKHEGVTKVVVSKRYLAQILMEKKQRRREIKASNERSHEEPKTSPHHHSRSRFNRLGAWKPALDSISETQAR